jgi:hypothetical protein
MLTWRASRSAIEQRERAEQERKQEAERVRLQGCAQGAREQAESMVDLFTDGRTVFVCELNARGQWTIHEALSNQGVFPEMFLPFLKRLDKALDPRLLPLLTALKQWFRGEQQDVFHAGLLLPIPKQPAKLSDFERRAVCAGLKRAFRWVKAELRRSDLQTGAISVSESAAKLRLLVQKLQAIKDQHKKQASRTTTNRQSMADAAELLSRCRALGIHLTAMADGALVYEANTHPPPELLAELAANKAGLLSLLAPPQAAENDGQENGERGYLGRMMRPSCQRTNDPGIFL